MGDQRGNLKESKESAEAFFKKLKKEEICDDFDNNEGIQIKIYIHNLNCLSIVTLDDSCVNSARTHTTFSFTVVLANFSNTIFNVLALFSNKLLTSNSLNV